MIYGVRQLKYRSINGVGMYFYLRLFCFLSFPLFSCNQKEKRNRIKSAEERELWLSIYFVIYFFYQNLFCYVYEEQLRIIDFFKIRVMAWINKDLYTIIHIIKAFI